MTRTRRRYTRKERRHIAAMDAWTCRYCGHIVWPWQDAEVAHEVSVANGGSDDLYNVSWSHAKCNRSAGSENMPPFKRLSTVTIIILSSTLLLALLALIEAIL